MGSLAMRVTHKRLGQHDCIPLTLIGRQAYWNRSNAGLLQGFENLVSLC